MTKRLITVAILVVVLGGIAQMASIAQSGSASSPVIGVWRVSEVTFTGPNARTVKNPQPGIVIFTPGHYSIELVNTEAPRPELPLEGATDKQRADAFGPFTANAGTYAIKGNELTRTIMVAKNPRTMSGGRFNVETFKMEGKNTLWLTDKADSTGPTANPTTVKFTRLE